MAAKVFIDGEAGTTGLQIRSRLAGRGDIELLSLPDARRKDLAARAECLNAADITILCLPDDAARESVALIENRTTRVIDASTAHRVNPDWAYGFPEMDPAQGEKIAEARFVANPGCWPQGVIALLRPLIEAALVPADFPATVNGISGYSGGGRKMIADYEEEGAAASEFSPYGLTFAHKHLPEMAHFTGLAAEPLFTPAVGDFYEGMIVSVPLNLTTLQNAPSGTQLHAALADHYARIKGGFVELMPLTGDVSAPVLDPEALNGTNRMQLYVFANDEKRHVALVAVYGNLGKGASGAAVQNLNLMLGLDAATSLSA